MKLTRNGKLAELYKWTYASDLPPDLCTFFWGILLATIFFPITWITFPIKDFDRLSSSQSLFLRIVIGILMHIVLAVIAVLCINIYQNPWVALKIFGYGGAGAILIVAITLGLIYFFTDSKIYKEISSVVSERRKGFKEKYCPRIEWVQND